MATNVKAVQDWNNDGVLRITGAKTLKQYYALRQQQRDIPANEYGVFFAYSKAQFDYGYKELVRKGFINDGDVVKAFGGGAYGTAEGMKRWMDEAIAIDAQIARECDPYEIYLDEYNNHECCIGFDRDEPAVKRVLELFGLDRTKEAIEGRRFNACGKVEDIAAAMA